MSISHNLPVNAKMSHWKSYFCQTSWKAVSVIWDVEVIWASSHLVTVRRKWSSSGVWSVELLTLLNSVIYTTLFNDRNGNNEPGCLIPSKKLKRNVNKTSITMDKFVCILYLTVIYRWNLIYHNLIYFNSTSHYY